MLRSVKSYCYTDDCKDGFSGVERKLKWSLKLKRRQKLSEVMSEERMAAGAHFLVQLTAAADYFIIPGLARKLWKVAYTMMKEQIPKAIPVIYRETIESGRLLAWHAHWNLTASFG